MSIKSLLFNRLLPLYRLREIISYLYTWDLRKQEGVLEAVVRSSFINLLARGLGYLKNILIAVLLGFSVKTDGYFMALSLLGLFLIFADVFDSIGVPNLVRARQENMEEFKKLCGLLLTFALVLAVTSIILAFLLMPVVLKIPVGFKKEALEYSKVSYLLLLPYVFFSFLFNHFGAVLRSLRRFTVYFVSEFIISISSFLILLFGLLSYREYWIIPLSLSLSQIIATIYIIYESRDFIRFELYRDERVKYILKGFLQLSSLYGIAHLYIIVDRAFGSLLGEKGVSALAYGLMIASALRGILRFENIAITSLSEERKSLNKLNLYFKKLLIITLPVTILFFAFSKLIIRIFFGYGAFSHMDIDLTSEALRYYSLSIPFMFLWPLIYRVFQIRGALNRVAIISIAGVFLNGFLNYIFVIEFNLGISGICLGTFFAYIFLCLVGYNMLKRINLRRCMKMLKLEVCQILNAIIELFLKKPLKLLINSFSSSEPWIYREIFHNRYDAVIQNDFTDIWRDYLFKNLDRMEQLLDRLKYGLDEESRKIIDRVYSAYMFELPSSSKFPRFIAKAKDVFVEEELSSQYQCLSKRKHYRSRYKLPIDSYEVNVFFYESGLYYLRDRINLSEFLSDTIIIDGGGYVGDSMLIFYNYNPYKILVFEPNLDCIPLIEKTIKLNALDRSKVEILPLGLGDTQCKKTLYKFGGTSTTERVINGVEKIEVEIVSLDELFERNLLEYRGKRIGLIKLDIEGSELSAVKGALGLIREFRPILLISIYHRPEDFFLIKPMLQETLPDYNFMVRKLNPFNVTYETMLIAYTEG